jgi:hypothetical protein
MTNFIDTCTVFKRIESKITVSVQIVFIKKLNILFSEENCIYSITQKKTCKFYGPSFNEIQYFLVIVMTPCL